MRPTEKNPEFTNLLVHSASPYLRQHAHNPVFWYPWGAEAIERAMVENKPILISIGYSTCYWCHVMEREVFMNPSIAALMNQHFINIKVDREEHPQLDEMYMVARQMMTKEGGWPNNIFVTPELKPFYAGGTFAPSDSHGRPGFPRVLEWLHHAWTAENADMRKTADEVAEAVRGYLQYVPEKKEPVTTVTPFADKIFTALKGHYDASAGGFFQAPKFPHEHYLRFLLTYHARTGSKEALDMATHSLKRMAAGGIYDQVGCGFHRYAVDKEWYVPHFEKMLYTQAMLARIYTDAAQATGDAWLESIARGTLEFTLGPLTDGNGAFYAAIDAETDGAEGAYYAWNAEELQTLLKPEEVQFLITFFALADIPSFPGHKHVNGQVLVMRQPLDAAAKEKNMPYAQLAAMSSAVMNKLLAARNKRQAPNLDNKIIVSWNGLMIDALAHAGKVFNQPRYTEAAKKAADYLLEHALDNRGMLQRIIVEGEAQIPATLEDYAYFIKGLLTLNYHDEAKALIERADELFYDKKHGAYFFTQTGDVTPVRIKSGDDGTLPNANAVMLENLIRLQGVNGDVAYKNRAVEIRDYFLSHNDRVISELSSLVEAALMLEEAKTHVPVKPPTAPQAEIDSDYMRVTALRKADTVEVTLAIRDGWHIQANETQEAGLVPTQLDVRGKGVELLEVIYPEPEGFQYSGAVTLKARLLYVEKDKPYPPLTIRLRFQPCKEQTCHKVQDISLSL